MAFLNFLTTYNMYLWPTDSVCMVTTMSKLVCMSKVFSIELRHSILSFSLDLEPNPPQRPPSGVMAQTSHSTFCIAV